jgi:predicted nucleotidyltransferase component of viral defense system
LIDLIKDKLKEYKTEDPVQKEYAIKEILQEIALYGLWMTGFFELAAFQGGTSLRILHGMPRFSEDLDFILKEPDPGFEWSVYLNGMVACFEEFGLTVEILDKSRMDQRIKKALLKDSSTGLQFNLNFSSGRLRKIQKIKFEIDVNPPEYSNFEYTYLDFPLDFEVCHQDLPSNFALKLHAMLCRPYVKGRDWYDFNWYIKKNVPPNLGHLESALDQWGPWKNLGNPVDIKWLKTQLAIKTEAIDWKETAEDVRAFVMPLEQHSLNLWSREYFMHKIEQITTS